MTRLSRWAQGLALASHVALMLGILWLAHWSPSAWLALPLALPLYGLVRGRSYTYAWASMLVTFYAGLYLSIGWSYPDQRFSAFLLAGFAAADFAGLVMYVRWSARERAAGVG